jgi:hypothetical protein
MCFIKKKSFAEFRVSDYRNGNWGFQQCLKDNDSGVVRIIQQKRVGDFQIALTRSRWRSWQPWVPLNFISYKPIHVIQFFWTHGICVISM